MEVNLLLTNEDIIRMSSYYSFPNEDKYLLIHILTGLGYASPVDGFINLLMESAGIYVDEMESHSDDCVLYLITVNTFSNCRDICPYYWESENLDILGDDVYAIVEDYSSDETQLENILFMIRGMIYEVMKMIIFPMNIITSNSLDVSFKILHYPGSYVVFTIPTLYDYENEIL